ncbi:restriction endonuclease [Streptomyces cuspidosporus]|uniref:Restriction endonuclease n=1 Tax=Streptomyces cuspidosporus TaxID=66882 RepID=A0ABN3FLL6_9ACTN
MADSGRRPRAGRQHVFSLRQLSLCFGLVAIVLCGAGLLVKVAAREAADRPVAALVAGVALGLPALAAVRAVRRRRGRAAWRTAEVLPARGDAAAPEPAPVVPSLVEEPAGEAPYGTGAGIRTEPETEAEVAIEDDVAYEAMTPEEFELAVAELCARDGCEDVRVVGGAGDLGADVLATAPDGRRLVIQCKRYTAPHKVGSQDVQRFGGTCFAVHEAHIAVVITTSEFTEPAVDYAAACGIRCFDGRELTEWARHTGPAPWIG